MWLFRLCCRDQQKVQIKKEIAPIQINAAKFKKERQSEKDEKEHIGAQSYIESNRFSKKDRYEGEEFNNFPHGNGSMLYANGDFYRGEWVYGKKQGRGLQIYQQLGMQYEGEWQNNQPSGSGKLLQSNNSYYIGEFKNGQKHGRGQFYDYIKKKQYNEYYSNGELKEHVEVTLSKSKEQEFPTLALDKQRFNTQDLSRFQQNNSKIKRFDVFTLLKYYGLAKISKLQCLGKSVKEWTIKQVIDFLNIVELKYYRQIFYQNKIKGKDLLSLTEKQLKEDLHMKMGDRKRFLNYLSFLKDIYKQEQSITRGPKQQKRPPYKLRSASSMKKVLRNVKNYNLFQQKIQQQNSESQNQSQQFRSNQRLPVDPISPFTGDREYDSMALDHHSLAKSANNKSSFEDIMQPKSERSSTKPINRKDSKDLEPNLESIRPKDHANKSANITCKFNQKINDGTPQSQHQKEAVLIKSSEKSSSTSSNESTLQLQRKKTTDKGHQSSQIRQLYQFLKGHRSLQFLIKQKDIQKLELIGQGSYGKVYKGKYVGMQIAIKDYLKTKKHHHKQDFMKEVEIISDLTHPNIVLYMGMCITANKYTLITEYLQNGSLFDQLHKKKRKFTSVEQIQIAFDIVKGMVYLHNMKKILHRDLKSSNVLIGEDLQVKLCDFGLSAQKKKQKKNKNRIGTYQWMAPQVIRNQQKIDQFADVYSFGVIVWEILTQKIPYEGLSEQQIIGLVGYDQQHHLPEPTNGPIFLKDIMNKCLKRQAHERPTFMQVQSEFEQYFTQIKQKTPLF